KPVQELAAEPRPAAPSPLPLRSTKLAADGAAMSTPRKSRLASSANAVPLARTSNLAMAGALPPARIPPEALATPRRVSTVAVAIGISVVLHAIALSLH